MKFQKRDRRGKEKGSLDEAGLIECARGVEAEREYEMGRWKEDEDVCTPDRYSRQLVEGNRRVALFSKYFLFSPTRGGVYGFA